MEIGDEGGLAEALPDPILGDVGDPEQIGAVVRNCPAELRPDEVRPGR